jgi:hypothetical protein
MPAIAHCKCGGCSRNGARLSLSASIGARNGGRWADHCASIGLLPLLAKNRLGPHVPPPHIRGQASAGIQYCSKSPLRERRSQANAAKRIKRCRATPQRGGGADNDLDKSTHVSRLWPSSGLRYVVRKRSAVEDALIAELRQVEGQVASVQQEFAQAAPRRPDQIEARVRKKLLSRWTGRPCSEITRRAVVQMLETSPGWTAPLPHAPHWRRLP